VRNACTHSVICILFAAVAHAAVTVSGIVSDESGAVIPGVTVSLRPTTCDCKACPARPRCECCPDTRVAVTDAAGAYRFENVAAVRYVLDATLEGFGAASGVVDATQSTAGVIQQDVILRLLPNEVITVSNEAPVLDITGAAPNQIVIARSDCSCPRDCPEDAWCPCCTAKAFRTDAQGNAQATLPKAGTYTLTLLYPKKASVQTAPIKVEEKTTEVPIVAPKD
jgi:Carboxypeptidase regulatory-like domain